MRNGWVPWLAVIIYHLHTYLPMYRCTQIPLYTFTTGITTERRLHPPWVPDGVADASVASSHTIPTYAWLASGATGQNAAERFVHGVAA